LIALGLVTIGVPPVKRGEKQREEIGRSSVVECILPDNLFHTRGTVGFSTYLIE
jgi:hypothetical protein